MFRSTFAVLLYCILLFFGYLVYCIRILVIDSFAKKNKDTYILEIDVSELKKH